MNKLYAFQSWENGGTQLSALYEGDEASEFINNHGLSNTFAKLHVFQDKLQAQLIYNQLLGLVDEDGVTTQVDDRELEDHQMDDKNNSFNYYDNLID